MRLTLTTFIVISICNCAIAGGELENQGARATALGGATIALNDVWSSGNNPGAMALVSGTQIGMSYGTRFFLSQAGMKTLVACTPLSGSVMGLSAFGYGFSGYSNNRIGLSYGRMLSDQIALGVQFNYVQFKMGDIYGQRSTLTGAVGMMIIPNQKLQLGVHVYNPSRAKLADFNNERTPSLLRLGARFSFSSRLSSVAEVSKDTQSPMNIKIGVEYQPIDVLFIRTGFASYQNLLSFGFGLVKNGIRIDASASWSQYLDYQSAIGLSYEFARRKK